MTRMDTLLPYRFRGRRRDPGARPVAVELTQAVLRGSTDSTLGSSPMWRYTPRSARPGAGNSRPPSAWRPGGTPARRSVGAQGFYEDGGQADAVRFGGRASTSRRRTRRSPACCGRRRGVLVARRSPRVRLRGDLRADSESVDLDTIPGGSSGGSAGGGGRPGCVGRDGQRHRGSIRNPRRATGLVG